MTAEWLVRLGPGREPVLAGEGPAVARRGGVTVILAGVLYGEDDPADAVIARYLRAGSGAFAGLRGRFALLVWDAPRSELLALRDPLGTHPLHHAKAASTLLIAPTVDRLLAEPGVSRDVDALYVAGQLIRGFPSAPDETAFPSVKRIPAGHLLRTRGSASTVERYWAPPPERPAPADVQERFDALLEQAVARCQGAGRAAVFLSGGIDSALIAAASARVSSTPPVALSILNPTPDADEEWAQRKVAAELGLELIAVAPDEAVPAGEILSRSLAMAGDSLWPPGPLQSVGDVLARRARAAGCTVVLDGNGGDEWLMPFASLASERLLRLDLRALRDLHRAMPYVDPGASSKAIARYLLWGAGLRRLARAMLHDLSPRPFAERLRQRTRDRATPRYPAWLIPGRHEQLVDWAIDRDSHGPLLALHRADKLEILTAPFSSALLEAQYGTRRGAGLELMSPIWDADLVAFLTSLPQRALVTGGQAKSLARGYLEGRVSFVRRWPPKTFGDSVIIKVQREEWRTVWSQNQGLPTLSELGVVDAYMFDPGHVAKELTYWDVLSAEGWLGSRISSGEP